MTLQAQGLQTLEQLRAFLEDRQPLDFEAPRSEAAYPFLGQLLSRPATLPLLEPGVNATSNSTS